LFVNPVKQVKTIWAELQKKGSFVNTLAQVFSVRTLVAALGFITAPILTRLYSPEAYGLLGIFNAIVASLALLATLRFSAAFTLPRSNKVFYSLLRISITACLLFSALVALAFWLFGPTLLPLLGAQKIQGIAPLLGLGVLIAGLFDIMNQWTVRLQSITKLSRIEMVNSPLMKGSNIALGYFTNGFSLGLIIIEYLGKAIALWASYAFIIKKELHKAFGYYSKVKLRYAFKRYWRVATYNLSGATLSMLSMQMPAFIFTPWFGLEATGFFALSSSLLSIPLRLLGEGGIGPVMLQRATALKMQGVELVPSLRPIVWKLLRSLVLLVTAPFVLLTFVSKDLFSIVLGQEWATSGQIAAMLVFYFYYRLLASPCAAVYRVLEKENHILIFQFFLIFATVAGIVIGIQNESFMQAVMGYSLLSGLAYAGYLLNTMRLLKINLGRAVVLTLVLPIAAFATIYLLVKVAGWPLPF